MGTCTIPSESKCSIAVYDQERMTVLTGGACQLTGLPELAIQLLPTGWGFGGPLGVANRATAATYNRAGG